MQVAQAISTSNYFNTFCKIEVNVQRVWNKSGSKSSHAGVCVSKVRIETNKQTEWQQKHLTNTKTLDQY